MSLTESIQQPAAAESTFTRRYAAYAATLGLSPQVAIVHGNMTDFICWVQQRWREWEQVRGYAGLGGLSDEEHAAFDAWLEASGD